MHKPVLLLSVAIVFMSLACKASDTGNLVSSRFLCSLFGGTWIPDSVSEDLSKGYCKQESDFLVESQDRPDDLEDFTNNDASAPDLLAQPQAPSDPIIPTTEPSDSELLTLEECDGRPYIDISPLITQEENDCVSLYKLRITNNHPSEAIIIIPHFYFHTEDLLEDVWHPELADRIGPGVSIQDETETGFGFEKWGGFYSTCALRDGQLTFPVQLYTDGIFARKDLDGFEWITGEQNLEKLPLFLPNYAQ